MIKLMMNKMNLTPDDIRAATFHPFKDEWWIITDDFEPLTDNFKWAVATFGEEDRCDVIQYFRTLPEALDELARKQRQTFREMMASARTSHDHG
jgi:hypothetical protein